MEYEKFEKNKYEFVDIPSMLVVGGNAEENRSRFLKAFLRELEEYNILIGDLANCRLRDNQRNMALNIAYYISVNEELSRRTKNKKDLPMNKLPKILRMKPSNIESLRDYIIAYYIILTNDNYKWIKDYFKIRLRDVNNKKNNKANNEDPIIINKTTEIKRGIALKIGKFNAYILTSMGEVLDVKLAEDVEVGEICAGKEKSGLRKYKIHFAIVGILLMFLCCSLYVQYNKIKTIVVIQTTSSIKIHVNSFERVIYMYSPTEKGKNLITSVNGLNREVDDVVKDVFSYALNNNMIDKTSKTLVTINGDGIKYGSLVETNKFIRENEIPLTINNAGNEHKLPALDDK